MLSTPACSFVCFSECAYAPGRVLLCSSHSCCPAARVNGLGIWWALVTGARAAYFTLQLAEYTSVWEARSAWPCNSTWLDSSCINRNMKGGFIGWASSRLCGPAAHQGFSLSSSPRCFPAEEVQWLFAPCSVNKLTIRVTNMLILASLIHEQAEVLCVHM